MGETMSKRLKLHLGDADMEERAFPNPFPDYEAAASAAGFTAGAAEDAGRVCPHPNAEDPGLPFLPSGKVSRPPGPDGGWEGEATSADGSARRPRPADDVTLA